MERAAAIGRQDIADGCWPLGFSEQQPLGAGTDEIAAKIRHSGVK
ncbi:hypothetical protein [Exilibacterium tricleocarpae]|nr:hypothetical protein [Exilibacterium tricleocarpae]